MAVVNLVGLAINNDGDAGVALRRLPNAPAVLNDLAVSLRRSIELSVIVALPVGSNIEGNLVVLTTNHEDTVDKAVALDTVHGLSAEEVLAGSLKTSVETTDQVVDHEHHGLLVEIWVVVVVDLPEGVLLGVEVLPEPGHGAAAEVVTVGVLDLPVVDNESGLAKSLKGVLGGLGLSRGSGGGSGSGSGRGSSLGLLLLLGSDILDHFVCELDFGADSLEGVLVDDSVEPPDGGGVLTAPLLVKDSTEGAGDESGREDISQRDALTNKVSVGCEVSLEGREGLQGALGGLVDSLLVVGTEAEERTVPSTEFGEDLLVGEGQPTDNGSIVLLGLAEESSLLVLGGDYKHERLVKLLQRVHVAQLV